jgi:hypothetical protein
MSAVLITVFAVSIVGALGMALYGLRVLIGRWEQPRRLRHEAQRPLPPLHLAPSPVQQAPQAAPPVWVSPTGPAPAPLVAPIGIATPPPLTLPAGGIAALAGPPRTWTPPRASTPASAWTPPHRAPSPPPLPEAPRLARGSIPPDPTFDDAEADTDPGVPEALTRPESVVQRGARFSVIRSTRR